MLGLRFDGCRWDGAAIDIPENQTGAQCRKHFEKLVNAHQPWLGLDLGHADLADTKSLPQLGLGEAALLAQGAEMRS